MNSSDFTSSLNNIDNQIDSVNSEVQKFQQVNNKLRSGISHRGLEINQIRRDVEKLESDLNSLNSSLDYHLSDAPYKSTSIYSKRIPRDIIQLEEDERMDRIQRGVDPILFGKVYRVQQSLIHNMSSVSWQAKHLRMDAVKPIQENWKRLATDMERLIDEGVHFVNTKADKLGLQNKGSLVHIIAEEEKERIRRIHNNSIDKMADARRRRVEDELMQTVKLVN